MKFSSLACEAGASVRNNFGKGSLMLHMPMLDRSDCENHASEAWQVEDSDFKDSVTHRLLDLCIRTSVPKYVQLIFQLLGKSFGHKSRFN